MNRLVQGTDELLNVEHDFDERDGVNEAEQCSIYQILPSVVLNTQFWMAETPGWLSFTKKLVSEYRCRSVTEKTGSLASQLQLEREDQAIEKNKKGNKEIQE